MHLLVIIPHISVRKGLYFVDEEMKLKWLLSAGFPEAEYGSRLWLL